jgi:two-component system, NarL family, sensor kinase
MQKIPEDIRIGYYIALFITLLIILFVVIFVFIYRKRQTQIIVEKKLMKSQYENQLLQTQIEIQEQTLTNVSQELHDNIGQSLTLAKLNLNTLKLKESQQAQDNIDATKTLISNALTNIRDLAKSMLGEKITEIGLQQAVQNELKLIEQSGKYAVQFSTNGEVESLNPQQELVAFRILQEAIHNIIKHADATLIKVQFDYGQEATTIIITDNGKGFDREALNVQETGIGLKNMHNRAALINAKLLLQSSFSHGTSLTLTINRK